MSNDTSSAAAEAALEFTNALRTGQETLVHLWVQRFGRGADDTLVAQQANRTLARFGDTVVAGGNPDLPPEIVTIFHDYLGKPGGRELPFTMDDIMMRRLWGKTRIAYQIDPDLWAELGDTDDSDMIHAEVFEHLPHPNPYIHFPEPLVLDAGGEDVQRVTGMFVVGRKDFRRTLPPDVTVTVENGQHRIHGGEGSTLAEFMELRCSTHDPDSDGLALMFCGSMHRRDGSPIMATIGGRRILDTTFTRIGLEFPGSQATTFAELIDHIRARFTMPYYDPVYQGDPFANMETMVRRALSALVYVCATNADIERQPAQIARQATKRRTDGGTVKPPKVMTVGYRVGAALRAWRARPATGYPGAPTGRTVRPHVRKAHFHTFRFGKGRTRRRVKWLPPIPINLGDADADTTTVVPVTR
jgi:hypothetical protein